MCLCLHCNLCFPISFLISLPMIAAILSHCSSLPSPLLSVLLLPSARRVHGRREISWAFKVQRSDQYAMLYVVVRYTRIMLHVLQSLAGSDRHRNGWSPYAFTAQNLNQWKAFVYELQLHYSQRSISQSISDVEFIDCLQINKS